MRLFYSTFFLIACSLGSHAQLKPFAFYYDHKNTKLKYWKLKNFPIKLEPNNTLYVNDILVFKSSGDSIEYFELLDSSYIFISLFDTSYRYQSIGSTLWRKGHVIIISIKDPSRKYFVDIEKRCRSNGIIEFDEKKKLLKIKDLKSNEVIDLKVEEQNT